MFLSLFSYDWDANFLRSLVERWNYVSNTIFLEDRELTITPIDLNRLSGLPIFSIPYDEYIPTAHNLLPSVAGGSKYISGTLRHVFRIYSELSSREQ